MALGRNRAVSRTYLTSKAAVRPGPPPHLSRRRQSRNVLEQVRAEFDELGWGGFRGGVNQVGGAASGAVVGEDTGDAAGVELGPREKPWQETDADSRGERLAQKEEVVAGSAGLHGDFDDAFGAFESEAVAAGIEDDMIVLGQNGPAPTAAVLVVDRL